MKKIVLNLIVILMTCMSFVSCAYERVDAGCEGIYVNLYGDDKGVGDSNTSCVNGQYHTAPEHRLTSPTPVSSP